MASMK